jgi:hypothetical protein
LAVFYVKAGIRQLIRSKPLETETFELINGDKLTVPTIDEITRIKAYLCLTREYGRDFIDLIALYDKNKNTIETLLGIYTYYDGKNKIYKKPLATELTMRLSAIKKENLYFRLNKSDIKVPYNNFDYIDKTAKEISIRMIKENYVQ